MHKREKLFYGNNIVKKYSIVNFIAMVMILLFIETIKLKPC